MWCVGRREGKEVAEFTQGASRVLIATDVFARGMDVQQVSLVVNVELPHDRENYIHRIGRTGRAGATGKAVTFWNKDYDIPCAPALAAIAREAGQPVPDWLEEWAAKSLKMKKQDKNWKY